MAVLVKGIQSTIMAYLRDFYHLDIDDSYTEYVISELKYNDNDILLLDVDSIAKVHMRTTLSHLWQVSNRHKMSQVSTKALKIFCIIPLKYVWKIIDIVLYIYVFLLHVEQFESSNMRLAS